MPTEIIADPSSSSIPLSSIPLLETDNWEEWWLQADQWITYMEYDDLLTDEAPTLDEDEAQAADAAARLEKKRALWNRRNKRVYTALKYRLGTRAKKSARDYMELSALIDFLRDEYQGEGAGQLEDNAIKLMNIRLANYKNIDDYAEEIKTTHRDIQNIDPKCALPEFFLMMFFMNGLDSSYKTFSTNLS
jgi:hypothetical protein